MKKLQFTKTVKINFVNDGCKDFSYRLCVMDKTRSKLFPDLSSIENILVYDSSNVTHW